MENSEKNRVFERGDTSGTDSEASDDDQPLVTATEQPQTQVSQQKLPVSGGVGEIPSPGVGREGISQAQYEQYLQYLQFMQHQQYLTGSFPATQAPQVAQVPPGGHQPSPTTPQSAILQSPLHQDSGSKVSPSVGLQTQSAVNDALRNEGPNLVQTPTASHFAQPAAPTSPHVTVTGTQGYPTSGGNIDQSANIANVSPSEAPGLEVVEPIFAGLRLKLYFSGFLYRKSELDSHGNIVVHKPDVPQWTKYWVELWGPSMKMYTASDEVFMDSYRLPVLAGNIAKIELLPDREVVQSIKANQQPKYVNILDSTTSLLPSLPYPPHDADFPPFPYSHFFTLSSAGNNLFLMAAPTPDAAKQWVTAIRVAEWEMCRAQEGLTSLMLADPKLGAQREDASVSNGTAQSQSRSLFGIGLGSKKTSSGSKPNKFRRGYVSVRCMYQTGWDNFYAVIMDEVEYEARRGTSTKSSTPASAEKSRSVVCFYVSEKEAASKKGTPIMVVRDIFRSYAVWPEKSSLIGVGHGALKIEGKVILSDMLDDQQRKKKSAFNGTKSGKLAPQAAGPITQATSLALGAASLPASASSESLDKIFEAAKQQGVPVNNAGNGAGNRNPVNGGTPLLGQPTLLAQAEMSKQRSWRPDPRFVLITLPNYGEMLAWIESLSLAGGITSSSWEERRRDVRIIIKNGIFRELLKTSKEAISEDTAKAWSAQPCADGHWGPLYIHLTETLHIPMNNSSIQQWDRSFERILREKMGFWNTKAMGQYWKTNSNREKRREEKERTQFLALAKEWTSWVNSQYSIDSSQIEALEADALARVLQASTAGSLDQSSMAIHADKAATGSLSSPAQGSSTSPLVKTQSDAVKTSGLKSPTSKSRTKSSSKMASSPVVSLVLDRADAPAQGGLPTVAAVPSELLVKGVTQSEKPPHAVDEAYIAGFEEDFEGMVLVDSPTRAVLTDYTMVASPTLADAAQTPPLARVETPPKPSTTLEEDLIKRKKSSSVLSELADKLSTGYRANKSANSSIHSSPRVLAKSDSVRSQTSSPVSIGKKSLNASNRSPLMSTSTQNSVASPLRLGDAVFNENSIPPTLDIVPDQTTTHTSASARRLQLLVEKSQLASPSNVSPDVSMKKSPINGDASARSPMATPRSPLRDVSPKVQAKAAPLSLSTSVVSKSSSPISADKVATAKGSETVRKSPVSTVSSPTKSEEVTKVQIKTFAPKVEKGDDIAAVPKSATAKDSKVKESAAAVQVQSNDSSEAESKTEESESRDDDDSESKNSKGSDLNSGTESDDESSGSDDSSVSSGTYTDSEDSEDDVKALGMRADAQDLKIRPMSVAGGSITGRPFGMPPHQFGLPGMQQPGTMLGLSGPPVPPAGIPYSPGVPVAKDEFEDERPLAQQGFLFAPNTMLAHQAQQLPPAPSQYIGQARDWALDGPLLGQVRADEHKIKLANVGLVGEVERRKVEKEQQKKMAIYRPQSHHFGPSQRQSMMMHPQQAPPASHRLSTAPGMMPPGGGMQRLSYMPGGNVPGSRPISSYSNIRPGMQGVPGMMLSGSGSDDYGESASAYERDRLRDIWLERERQKERQREQERQLEWLRQNLSATENLLAAQKLASSRTSNSQSSDDMLPLASTKKKSGDKRGHKSSRATGSSRKSKYASKSRGKKSKKSRYASESESSEEEESPSDESTTEESRSESMSESESSESVEKKPRSKGATADQGVVATKKGVTKDADPVERERNAKKRELSDNRSSKKRVVHAKKEPSRKKREASHKSRRSGARRHKSRSYESSEEDSESELSSEETRESEKETDAKSELDSGSESDSESESKPSKRKSTKARGKKSTRSAVKSQQKVSKRPKSSSKRK